MIHDLLALRNNPFKLSGMPSLAFFFLCRKLIFRRKGGLGVQRPSSSFKNRFNLYDPQLLNLQPAKFLGNL